MIRTRAQLGQALADARRSRGLTQAALARLIDKSHIMIGKWERGTHTPSASDLLAVMHHLDHHLAITDHQPQPPDTAARGIPIHTPAQAGQLINEIRYMQAMTARELAAAIGVSEGVISRWRRTDTPSLANVIKAGEALGWQLAFVPGPEDDA